MRDGIARRSVFNTEVSIRNDTTVHVGLDVRKG